MNTNTTFPTSQQVLEAALQEEPPAPVKALMTLSEVLGHYEGAQESFLFELAQAEQAIKRAQNDFERGLSINPLGILQSRGPSVDRAAALLDARQQAAGDLMRALGVSTEDFTS